jgi:hypothetical protein
MKFDSDLIKSVMQRNEIDVRTVATVLEELEREAKEAAPEKAPGVKKQFVVLVSDPDGDLPDKDFTAWVVQIPEEDSPATAVDRIVKSAYDFNQTPKGRRLPARSIGEACEAVPARICKEQALWIKTKEPVLVMRTDNKIPFDPQSRKDFI